MRRYVCRNTGTEDQEDDEEWENLEHCDWFRAKLDNVSDH